MKTIRDLNAPPHIAGRLEAIVVRGAPRDPARRVERTAAIAGVGLADDRLGQRGEAELSTRQVTLIQAEHLDVIARLARVAHVDPVGLRRNLVVAGINLDDAERLARADPRMEQAIGPGGYAAMRGHGGMTARIVASGAIAVGDAVLVAA